MFSIFWITEKPVVVTPDTDSKYESKKLKSYMLKKKRYTNQKWNIKKA